MRAHAPRVELGLVAGAEGPLLEQAEAMGVRTIALPLGGRLANLGDSALGGRGGWSAATTSGRLALGALTSLKYVAELRGAIREFRPSVVHSNGIKMHLLAAAARTRALLVWHIRNFIGDRPLVPLGLRAVAWRADGAIAISKAVGEDARRVFARLPLSVVYDAIDTDAFAPLGRVADLDALAGREPVRDCVRIGLVATYARWKGHDVFLESARALKSMPGVPELLFYIVGGPIYDRADSQYQVDELRHMAQRLGVEDAVRFVPFQERVDEVYRALDVVVHASSRREPFGRTIAEGMASGKPVLASRGSGASELFSDGVDAVSVPARDAGALAEALRSLALRPAERDRLGRAARITAVERFSRARLARQIFAAYEADGVEVRAPEEARVEGGTSNWTMVSKEQKR
jgi:glycosyltransferase involved in cell wall biosynthesis